MARLKRILIHGATPSDVHGVFLREEVVRIAKDCKVQGQVRNVKNQSWTEIIYAVDDEQAEAAFVSRLEKLKGREEFKIAHIDSPTENLFDPFKDFKLVREDDLTEMVWGLQGAGKVFQLVERRRAKSLGKGFALSIPVIAEHAGRLLNSETKAAFNLFALERFLSEPPPQRRDEDLNQVWALHSACHEANGLLQSGAPEGKLGDILKRILDLTNSIQTDLNKDFKERGEGP